MRKRELSLLIVITLIVALMQSAISFAWFTNGNGFQYGGDEGLISSNSSYYGGGKGTEESPYIISNPRHLYNLAWLQDLGFYDNDPRYFSLEDDIDMSDYEIPPIGIDDHPFVSVFNGNDKIIYNLNVNTYFGDKEYHMPSDKVFEERIDQNTLLAGKTINTTKIGLFGTISSKELSTRKYVSNVSNFYIANATIKARNITDPIVGIIAGYVDGNLSNVGVYNSTIQYEKNRHETLVSTTFESSKYAFIGDYNSDKIKWESVPTGGSGESLAYGGNFDVDKLSSRLSLIYKNKNNADASMRSSLLPNVDSASILSAGQKMPLTVSPSSINEENYVNRGSQAREIVSSQNIGYILGNQNKINNKTINYSSHLVEPSDPNNPYVFSDGKTPLQAKKTPNQLFRVISPNGTYSKTNIRPIDDEELKTLPSGIQALVANPGDKKEKSLIRLQQRYPGGAIFANPTDNDKWGTHGQIDYFGEKYGEDVAPGQAGGIYLPNNGIWFKPKNPGKFRFVLYTANDGECFSLVKINRNGATKENPFAATSVDTSLVYDDSNSDYNKRFITKNLPKYLLIYYEYDVTQEEIDNNTEFYICNGDASSGGAYFVYLDIGINGGGGSSGEIKVAELDKIGFVNNVSNEGNDYVLNDELNTYDSITSVGLLITLQKSFEKGIVKVSKTNDVIKYNSSIEDIVVSPFGKGDFELDSLIIK